jgi:hypothetical protein
MIIISYTLESFVEWIQKRKKVSAYKRLEWTTNETLQLQRLAHEELRCGIWIRAAKDNPVTLFGERLALLDIADPKHPVLKCPVVKTQASSDGTFVANPKQMPAAGPIQEAAVSDSVLNGTIVEDPTDAASFLASTSNAASSPSPNHLASSADLDHTSTLSNPVSNGAYVTSRDTR